MVDASKATPITTFKLSQREKDFLERIAENSNMTVSALIRDLIFVEAPALMKGILYLKKFFEKYGNTIRASDEELDKVSDTIDLAEKIAGVYKQ